jgi:DNA-binding response OmpR family regulator
MINVLLIEDDTRLANLVVEFLGQNEVDLKTAGDGERGLSLARSTPGLDVILLDLMLPGMSGLEVCKKLRGEPELADVGVIMLTAKGDEVDKIVGLELGADDYLAKPFNPRELLARVRAVARRRSAMQVGNRARFRTGELEIDFAARSVSVAGVAQALTHHEFEVLALLARAAGRVLTRDYLLDALRGEEPDAFDRTIDVHISKLRAKLEPNPKEPRYIKTVRGAGYLLARVEVK